MGDHDMTIIYSADGATVTKRYTHRPRGHWEPTSPTEGRWVLTDVEHGYFPLTETDRPADTDEGAHVYGVVRDGARFVETWTLLRWTEDEIAAAAAAAARAAQRETAHSWLRVLSEWAQSDDAGTDPSEVALAVRLTVEAAAVLLAEPAD